MAENQTQKSWMEWLSLAFKAATPIVIAVIGWQVTASIERSKTQAEYVRIALEILQSDSQKHSAHQEMTEDQHALRGWAVRVLSHYSPVDMSEEEQSSLMREGIAAREAALRAALFSETSHRDFEKRIRALQEQIEEHQKNYFSVD